MRLNLAPFLMIFALLHLDASYAQGVIRMGVFPRRPPDVTQQMFQPLADYLSRELNRRVIIQVPVDYPAFWSRVRSGVYDLVHYNQYHYVRARKLYGHRLIARNVEFGSDQISAVLAVRKDHGIKGVSDLIHQKVLFGGGRDAMVSYIMVVDLLRQAGLRSEDYFTQFAASPPSALIAAYYRQGAAAGIGEPVMQLKGLANKIEVNDMEVLVKSEAVAQLPWAVSKRVDDNLAKAIKAALLKLDKTAEGKRILKAAELDRLIEAKDEDYQVHRRIISRVLNESY